jgi:hypothetical protein
MAYQVSKNNKLFINQAIIPAIAGRKKFQSQEQARSVAELVLKKLSNREDCQQYQLKN